MKLEYVYYSPEDGMWFDHHGDPIKKQMLALEYNARIKNMLLKQQSKKVIKTRTCLNEN
jgi:hypothetical protein